MTDASVAPAHLILNPASGGAAALLRRLTRAARERGIRVRALATGEDARHAALEAADDGAKALAVVGGDGSVAAVAGAAVERGLPLVVVPTGTLDHFARDLGLDLAPAARPRRVGRRPRAARGRRPDQRPAIHQQRLAWRLRGDAGRPGV
ncbi:MAG TPA: acylglycerol kinase family protein, partial [Rubrobacter sp.]|nr:acylglycerol kinase family protein [Rubrobacter sp.]